MFSNCASQWVHRQNLETSLKEFIDKFYGWFLTVTILKETNLFVCLE